MKILPKAALMCLLALSVACNKKNKMNDTDDDLHAPCIEDEVIVSKEVHSTFDTLPSAVSLSTESFIPDRVGYDFDSAVLNKSQMHVLDAQIDFIKENMHDVKEIRIEGFCDERGSTTYNYALGEKRANEVKHYFVKHEIPAYLIKTISYGKERVLVEGSSDLAYAQNRVAKVTLCKTKGC